MDSLKAYSIIILVCLCYSLHSQCPGSLECEGAEVFCSIDVFNGFACNTPSSPNASFPLPTLCHGVGTPTNLNWWAFVGNGKQLSLTFNFDLGACQNLDGVQAGIFEDNCDGSQILDCNADCNTTSFTLSGQTIKCEIYYLWIDGCNGDVCSYTISVNGGGPPSLQRPMPNLHVEGNLCPGGWAGVCFPGYLDSCDPVFEWTVDGVPTGGPNDECIEVRMSDTEPFSPVQVCLTATIGNPNVPSAICDQDMVCTLVTPDPVEQVIGQLRTICSSPLPFIWHGIPITQECITPPCSVRLRDNEDCVIDSLVPFQILPPELKIGASKNIPPQKQPFYWHGMLITSSCVNPPCSVRLIDQNGCYIDSVRQFRLLRYPPDTGQLSGLVWHDQNNNCDNDQVDVVAPDIVVSFYGSKDTFQTLTDAGGGYDLLLPYDTYEIETYDPISGIFGCERNTIETIDINREFVHNEFFIGDSSCFDGRLRFEPLSGRNRLRCDMRRRTLVLNVANQGADTLPADSLIITVDSLMKLLDASLPFDKISSDMLIVKIPVLFPGGNHEIRIRFTSDCNFDDESKETCFKAYYYNEYRCEGHLVEAKYCGVILNSKDPNDLTVTPYGVLDERYIEKDDKLSGVIRFHNTGSDTAYDVVIDLELSANDFDINSIRMTDASYPGSILRIREGKVSFVLPDISLPHDGIDSVNSHGYLTYIIETVSDIEEWEDIDQQAHIYFDHNLPIATNIERQTIAGPYVYGNVSVQVCEGDSFRNHIWYRDTAISDTIVRVGPDSISTIDITVHSNYAIGVDTQILAGDLFGEFPVYRDTIITIDWRTQAGCDSIVTYNIDAVTTKSSDHNIQLLLYPNPVGSAELLIRLDAPDSGTLHLLNSRGERELVAHLEQEQSSIQLPDKLSTGLYYYLVKLDNGGTLTGRLVIQ